MTMDVIDDRRILAERVRQRVEMDGRSPREISIAATGKPDLIRDIYRLKRMPTGPVLFALAQELGTTTDWLLGKVENPAQVESEVSFHELPQSWRGPTGDGIPLIGTAYCDDLLLDQDGDHMEIERLQIQVDHVVRMIQRPAALWNATDAYAIYFQGSSMERRFYQGDIGIVDPRRPPRPGEIVLAQLNDGKNDGVMTALAKELVKVASAYVELRQYNPELTFRVPRAQVERLHRIYRPDELLLL